MIIKNVENFKDFLDKNLKIDYYDFNAYLEDLEKRYFETSFTTYELKRHETKSGQIELFFYRAEIVEDGDDFITILTF